MFSHRGSCALRLCVAIAFGALAATAASAGTDPAVAARHLLNRLAYGPAPGDLEGVTALGADAWLEQQLHPERLEMPAVLRQKLAALDTIGRSSADLFAEFGPPARKALAGDAQARKQFAKAATRVAAQAQEARLLRAVYSPAQLQEVLTEFWFNHFNVFAGKGLDRIWVGTYERDAIRPYVLGRFRDLLGATAKHPAMLFYLDNVRSVAPGFVPRRPRPDAPTGLNENYARELMELHTLGVDGGYSQKDVTELARILTGWTYLPREMAQGGNAGFVFDPRRHDDGEKVFLGQRFPAGHGQDEGERALDLLAASPVTAHRLAFQLAQFFVADAPPPALVERVAERFRDSGGDLRETLRTLLGSREFAQAPDNGFKTPYQFVVSGLRASGIDLRNPRPALQALKQLGQPVYGCQTPDGYKSVREAWLNPGAMLTRVTFATALGSGRLTPRLEAAPDTQNVAAFEAAVDAAAMPPPADAGYTPPPMQAGETHAPPLDWARLEQTLDLALSADSRQTIEEAAPRLRAGLLLGSPEFMQR